jgi:hypothetical protein
VRVLSRWIWRIRFALRGLWSWPNRRFGLTYETALFKYDFVTRHAYEQRGQTIRDLHWKLRDSDCVIRALQGDLRKVRGELEWERGQR